ncbi:MAG: hypothetical protein AAF528_00870 [Cyanobacteria bacterium P01_C01_bin.121]
MTTTQTQPSNVIDQMVAFRKQLAQLEAQIEALKPAFFNACTAQEVEQFQHPQAVIYRRLTPGKWDYPSDLIEQEQRLKQQKRQFQQTHEPVAGREVIWSIKLAP